MYCYVKQEWKGGYVEMKDIVKRPQFWIAMGSLLLAVSLAVVSSIVRPGISVLDKFEHGINKLDTKEIISCFPPDVQAEITRNDIDSLNAFAEIQSDNKINIIYEDAAAGDGGGLSVSAFIIQNQGNQCVSVECQVIDLESIDGKLYLPVY